MEEFKNIIAALSTNDWTTRLNNIDVLISFIKQY